MSECALACATLVSAVFMRLHMLDFDVGLVGRGVVHFLDAPSGLLHVRSGELHLNRRCGNRRRSHGARILGVGPRLTGRVE